MRKYAILLSLLLLLLPSVGFCSESQAYIISKTQLTALENHLNALGANNDELMALLAESNQELTEATQQLNESRKQIVELSAQLQALKSESEAARQSLKTANTSSNPNGNTQELKDGYGLKETCGKR